MPESLTERTALDPIAALRVAGSGFSVHEPSALHPRFREPAFLEYAGITPPGPATSAELLPARLRRRVRTDSCGTPEALLAELFEVNPGSPAGARALSVALDAFSGSVASAGRYEAEVALRRAFHDGPRALRPFLLDVAERHSLACFEIDDVTDAATDSRHHRHAAVRYLSSRCAEPAAIAALEGFHASAGNGYDRLLAAVALAGTGRPVIESAVWPPRRPVGPGGLTIAQSMLLGPADRPGAGASGGLTVLLRGLGDALGRQPGIGRVLTLVLCPAPRLEPGSPLVTGDDAHLTVRIPVDHGLPPAQTDLAQHRTSITFWTRHLLAATGLVPGLVHVRYADDGSVAIADAARALGARVVFTLTADPHRSLASRYGPGTDPDPAAAGMDLHRMYAADRLVAAADTLLTLPGRAPGELERYFPLLARGGRDATAIEEGITLRTTGDDSARQERLVRSLFTQDRDLPRFSAAARGLPLILSVGRLHPVKQQDLLLRAWLDRKLYRHYALAIVGGDLTNPTAEERLVLRRILMPAGAAPEAAGRLAVLPALPNSSVRLLEHGLRRFLPAATAHLYVCPSEKEEFGIAVLEAMEAGLVVMGPRRGGLGHYIRHGGNGFLADTGDPDRFADDLTAAVHILTTTPHAARAIGEAGRHTVLTRFDISQVAARFAGAYHRTVAAGALATHQPGPLRCDSDAKV
ncbi:glycosyltransferase family 4 protein [Amycolatopsis saalfeldensis]|uniref:D-inositol-3-phosphate glycosyltransferase n=1 Tax=Amycolatopsis saalfeldensis TaxID=394193 RepID=A0A1H8YP11_9PSEU|nr:glycosyltransferase family 4 protein [Amycolatopsis saalfeldensis]SEP53944.1 D-inositol-3-phosphate glycosyltransferase [Amycolatopsis saalfeldensis]